MALQVLVTARLTLSGIDCWQLFIVASTDKMPLRHKDETHNFDSVN